jgi:trimeric autotransporter adhesin
MQTKYEKLEAESDCGNSSAKASFVDCHRYCTEIHQATTTVSIDGLTRSVATDLDSNTTADRINTHALVNNADGIGEPANDNQLQSAWRRVS